MTTRKSWESRSLVEDVREYVECCVDSGVTPDAFDFSTRSYPRHKDVPGREIDDLIAKELARYGD